MVGLDSPGDDHRTCFACTFCIETRLTMSDVSPVSNVPVSEPPRSQQPMRHSSNKIQPLVFTIVAGCFIIIGLDRSELIPAIHPWVIVLYEWFVLLSAFGILLGVVNVFYLHLNRIAMGQADWGYSLALVATGLATLVAGLLQPTGVTSPTVEWIFDALLAPGAASLYALTIFFMAAAAFRHLRITTQGGGWMLAGALLMLVIQMPASNNFLPTVTDDVMRWLVDGPLMASLRGAILGSALALLLVGIRYILGRAQP